MDTAGYMKIEKDTASYFVIPNRGEGGDLTLEMEQITVYSKSRTLPERNGKVVIDFRITIPKQLLGSSRSIVVSPYLHLSGQIRPLTEIVIRGALFDKVQNRNYWQYSQFLRTFRPDSAGELWAYKRFIRNPMPEGVRVDSIHNNQDHFVYYYSQEVDSNETGKTMLITLETSVKGLDGSSAGLSARDTLRFNVSSILAFADTTTRYVKKVVERKAFLKDKRHITFRTNDWRIDENLADNYEELVAIENLLTELLSLDEFDIESVSIIASSSPEGNHRHNENLSRRRAEELKKYLVNLFGKELSPVIGTGWVGEDWNTLKEMIEADAERISKTSAILRIIEETDNPDRREETIKALFPQDYQLIVENFYPALRAVTFHYELSRKGMVKDTVTTTEVDNRYMQAMNLLHRRKYPEAHRILLEYRDVNTAVCLLSMGYDNTALEILGELPDGETTAYLKAVAYSRIGNKVEGRRWFSKALELNPQMEYRARLDPEINALLKP